MMENQRFQKYLERQNLQGMHLPLRGLVPSLIVVIPCYDESDIVLTLDSLEHAMSANVAVEVIVLVNSGEHTSKEIIEQNRITYKQLCCWRREGRYAFDLLPVCVENIRQKHAGAGYARKMGMDLAMWRFQRYENCAGVVVSLDADTLVAPNYFEIINQSFESDSSLGGVILGFEHPLSGNIFPAEVYEAVAQYELHLRYVNQGLKLSQFPYVHHTIGSAFAVRARAYVKYGGMNRRQGGEDFYFLHKLFPNEKFIDLSATCVYPSPRPSLRVPFGTGPQISNYLENKRLKTYHPDVFVLLRQFFSVVPLMYDEDFSLSPIFVAFLGADKWISKLNEIRSNASNRESFVKRFYAYFDAFQVVKFLNFSHQDFYHKVDVEMAAVLLLKQMKVEIGSSDLLTCYRKIEGR